LEQEEDLALVSLTLGGDEAAFAEIVRRYSPRVFQVASRFFRRRSDVEDAAQEVFLRAYTRLTDYEGRGSLEGWMTRIATTTCLNLLRDSKRRPEATLNDLPEEESDWLENRLADLSSAIRERDLSPDPFGFRKMWRAARVLVASMTAVVVTLAALTLAPDRERSPSDDLAAASSGADVVFEDDGPDNDDMTYDQAIMNLYDQETEGANGRKQ
jgi:RNA polymerase sigma factor (sigma-70 family)